MTMGTRFFQRWFLVDFRSSRYLDLAPDVVVACVVYKSTIAATLVADSQAYNSFEDMDVRLKFGTRTLRLWYFLPLTEVLRK
jgi:hypothetical protein